MSKMKNIRKLWTVDNKLFLKRLMTCPTFVGMFEGQSKLEEGDKGSKILCSFAMVAQKWTGCLSNSISDQLILKYCENIYFNSDTISYLLGLLAGVGPQHFSMMNTRKARASPEPSKEKGNIKYLRPRTSRAPPELRLISSRENNCFLGFRSNPN